MFFLMRFLRVTDEDWNGRRWENESIRNHRGQDRARLDQFNGAKLLAALKRVTNRLLASSRCMACVFRQRNRHQLARYSERKLIQCVLVDGK